MAAAKAKDSKDEIKFEDKQKALDAALSQIEKQFGKGAVMKLGDDSAKMNVEEMCIRDRWKRSMAVSKPPTVPAMCFTLALVLWKQQCFLAVPSSMANGWGSCGWKNPWWNGGSHCLSRRYGMWTKQKLRRFWRNAPKKYAVKK